ncbi:zinc finger SWIM domain-containing protein 7 homolog isoform X2 [Oppia nitens]|uniref:zinc finger SWIM domain-containing protein 7 homolog isoform X2 n=1 Tax=Oppia nitens TaxID=1686743 RepID=UPI0023DCDAD5|nr:zinc finger SWIM domain-containing protein 7 homolog isoform X2 [Oppia nitens]
MTSNCVQQLLEVLIEKIVKNDNKTDEVMENLVALFDTEMIEALELLDSDNVSKIVSNNNCRHIYQVESGEKSKTRPGRYFCLIDANYCSCDHFRKSLSDDSVLFCKHLIACKLSIAINSFKTITKTNEEMNDLWTKHILI